MPDSANLSELPLTPISSSRSAARATHCGTVSILISCPTNRTPDSRQLTQVAVLVGRLTHTSQLRGARNERGANGRDEGITEMDRQTDRRRERRQQRA